jgi:hypoxanthine phosphoribosyltransferase
MKVMVTKEIEDTGVTLARVIRVIKVVNPCAKISIRLEGHEKLIELTDEEISIFCMNPKAGFTDPTPDSIL